MVGAELLSRINLHTPTATYLDTAPWNAALERWSSAAPQMRRSLRAWARSTTARKAKSRLVLFFVGCCVVDVLGGACVVGFEVRTCTYGLYNKYKYHHNIESRSPTHPLSFLRRRSSRMISPALASTAPGSFT